MSTNADTQLLIAEAEELGGSVRWGIAVDALLVEVEQLRAALNEAGPLMEEAMSRPLWGSLQGSWQERARAWHKRHNATLRAVRG